MGCCVRQRQIGRFSPSLDRCHRCSPLLLRWHQLATEPHAQDVQCTLCCTAHTLLLTWITLSNPETDSNIVIHYAINNYKSKCSKLTLLEIKKHMFTTLDTTFIKFFVSWITLSTFEEGKQRQLKQLLSCRTANV